MNSFKLVILSIKFWILEKIKYELFELKNIDEREREREREAGDECQRVKSESRVLFGTTLTDKSGHQFGLG